MITAVTGWCQNSGASWPSSGFRDTLLCHSLPASLSLTAPWLSELITRSFNLDPGSSQREMASQKASILSHQAQTTPYSHRRGRRAETQLRGGKTKRKKRKKFHYSRLPGAPASDMSNHRKCNISFSCFPYMGFLLYFLSKGVKFSSVIQKSCFLVNKRVSSLFNGSAFSPIPGKFNILGQK